MKQDHLDASDGKVLPEDIGEDTLSNMNGRVIGILISVLVPCVGAYALPAQAAYERAAAAEYRARLATTKSLEPGSEDSESKSKSDSTPLLLLAARHWTVEKISRHCENPDHALQIATIQPNARFALSPWMLARLNRCAVALPRIQVLPLIRLHLNGTHAPPL